MMNRMTVAMMEKIEQNWLHGFEFQQQATIAAGCNVRQFELASLLAWLAYARLQVFFPGFFGGCTFICLRIRDQELCLLHCLRQNFTCVATGIFTIYR
jgi:hypothetical protein